jgi:hypothetical protein
MPDRAFQEMRWWHALFRPRSQAVAARLLLLSMRERKDRGLMYRDAKAQVSPAARTEGDRLLLRPDEQVPRLRLGMSLEDAEQVRDWLLAARGSSSVIRMRELIWLRAVFLEQWRRTPVSERHRFARRADSILERLSQSEPACPSDATVIVRHHDKP